MCPSTETGVVRGRLDLCPSRPVYRSGAGAVRLAGWGMLRNLPPWRPGPTRYGRARARTVSFRPWRGRGSPTGARRTDSRLLDAIGLWLGMLDDGSSEARWPKISADLDNTYFAWNGDAGGQGSIYYRHTGPVAHHRAVEPGSGRGVAVATTTPSTGTRPTSYGSRAATGN